MYESFDVAEIRRIEIQPSGEGKKNRRKSHRVQRDLNRENQELEMNQMEDRCSINTPSGGGCMHSSRRRPCELEKRKGSRNNALGRTRAGSSGRADRVANALVYAIERIDGSTPRRGTG